MHTSISHSQKSNSKGAEPPHFQKWGLQPPLPPLVFMTVVDTQSNSTIWSNNLGTEYTI